MERGLVSVIMPCYNSAHLAPMALASLLSQTYQEWECLCVDDGSKDELAEVASRARDERIRFLRLDQNQGRGRARQVAQQVIRGEFVAMLDADDWWYPSKLEKQVAYLREYSDAELVGAGLAIVDASGQMLGQRCCEPAEPAKQQRLAPPQLAFAAVCVRAAAFARHPFDPTFAIAEDVDWLLRVVLEERYGNVGEPLYAYFEGNTFNLRKRLSAAAALLRIWRKHFLRYPAQACWQSALTLAKAGGFSLAAALGQQPRMLARRSLAPTEDAVLRHQAALRAVLAVHDERFALSPASADPVRVSGAP
jgi:glycosyltransferase involved in cell wall biosynthesis